MSALFPPCKLYGWNPSPPLYWYVVCIERLTLLLWKVEHLPPYFTSAERLPFIYYSVMLSVLPPHLASRCLDKWKGALGTHCFRMCQVPSVTHILLFDSESLQWNLSNKDNLGTKNLSWLVRCPYFRGRILYKVGTWSSVLINQVSLFQGCPLREVPLYVLGNRWLSFMFHSVYLEWTDVQVTFLNENLTAFFTLSSLFLSTAVNGQSGKINWQTEGSVSKCSIKAWKATCINCVYQGLFPIFLKCLRVRLPPSLSYSAAMF